MRRSILLSTAMLAIGMGLLATALAGHAGRTVLSGGTFRAAFIDSLYPPIDPAHAVLGPFMDPVCAMLVNIQDKPAPIGNRILPEVAAGFPRVSNDQRTYTFTLRKGFRFSSGAELTARNYARALERILNPKMRSPVAPHFLDIVGARAVATGRAERVRGISAAGTRLVVRLTRPVPDFVARTALLCPVPENLPIDPEGVGAPLSGAGPYYVSKWTQGSRLELERNRFYGGRRPHHVERFAFEASDDWAETRRRIESGQLEWGDVLVTPDLARKYGVNRSRFYVKPSAGVSYYALNAARPLFRGNPRLRRAVNYALDRRALVATLPRFRFSATDHYLPPLMPGVRPGAIYPMRPNLRRARALARGHTRSGRAVLYVRNGSLALAQAQVVKKNLKAIGIDVRIKQFPTSVHFAKLDDKGEPFDLAFSQWFPDFWDPAATIDVLLHGRALRHREHFNFSHFNSPSYSRRIDLASRLTGEARYRAYGKLELELRRDAAPIAAWGVINRTFLFSSRVGCLIFRPELDLTAVCLKR